MQIIGLAKRQKTKTKTTTTKQKTKKKQNKKKNGKNKTRTFSHKLSVLKRTQQKNWGQTIDKTMAKAAAW